MILRNTITEKQVKPIGILIFSLLEIAIHRLLSISQSKSSRLRIICIHQVIHLAKDATVRSTITLFKREITIVVHLTIYTHLILRIHDIEIAVAWLQTHSEFTSIADTVCTSLTFLGCNNDDTSHGTCTINRGSRTILQNLEAFDIISIQTCNS